MSKNIAIKLDELLKNEIALDTRAGLRFLVELVRDAFEFIEGEKQLQEGADDKLRSFETRIHNIENGLHEWMEIRRREKDQADDERKFYRRAVIGGIIAIILSELARWFLP